MLDMETAHTPQYCHRQTGNSTLKSPKLKLMKLISKCFLNKFH